MSESTTTQRAMRPKEAEALAVFKALPEADRSYAAVANAMDISEGRAGVYVRDALAISGEQHLAPRRGRKGNGPSGTGRKERHFTKWEEMQAQYIAQADETVRQLEAQINEAREAAATFNADEWITAEAQRLDQIAKEARARASAFAKNDGDIATEAAQQQREALAKRAQEVQDQNEQILAEARDAKAQAERMMALAAETTTA